MAGWSLGVAWQKKYEELQCIGCEKNIETVHEMLTCSENKVIQKSCDGFLGDNVKDMVETAVELRRRLKVRQNFIDDIE